MKKTYISGDWYMTISNEMPMTNDGDIFCGFDLIKYQKSIFGFPVNQSGTMEEVLQTLKSWKEIDEKPEYDCIRKSNVDMLKMENKFIDILESELIKEVTP